MKSWQRIEFDQGSPSALPSQGAAYRCPLCRDTGFVSGPDGVYPCRCTQSDRLAEAQKQAGLTPLLIKQTFSAFDLSYYAADKLVPKSNVSYREQAERALARAKAFVAACMDGTATEGLFLEGGVGSGKTFLAAAIANALLEQHIPLRFLVVPDFLDELRASFRNDEGGGDVARMEAVRALPVLILDDLGAHNFTEWTKNKLLTLLNYRINYGLPTVITSNLDLQEVKDSLGDRIASRICQGCAVCHLDVASDIRLQMRRQRG